MNTRSPTLCFALVLTIATGPLGGAAVQSGLIDPDYAAAEEKMAAEQSRACSRLNPARQNACYERIYADYEKRGLLRGTSEYVAKNYQFLNPQQLDDQIRDRNRVFRQVRNLSTLDERRPGEVTYSDMAIEVSELARLIRAKGGMPPEAAYR